MNDIEITDIKTPIFDDYSIAQANQLLDSTVKKLSQLESPASPLFYSLFFTYLAQVHPSLNAKIDALLEVKTQLSHDDAKKLFLRFFYQSGDALDEEIRLDLLSASTQLVGSIVDVSSKTKSTNLKLEKHIESLTQAKNSQDVEHIVTAIIQNTQSFVDDSKSLEKNLLSTIQEIDILKQEFLSARQESLVDTLTGLFNRKGFMLAVEKCIRLGESQQKINFAVMTVNIDYFAAINEEHGHLAGDRVLAEISKRLSLHIRRDDCIARCNSDEYFVLLIDTPIEGAQKVAEKMRKSIQKLRIKRISTGVSIGTITASFGITHYIAEEIPEKIIERSIKALKQAKQQGRNKIVVI